MGNGIGCIDGRRVEPSARIRTAQLPPSRTLLPMVDTGARARERKKKESRNEIETPEGMAHPSRIHAPVIPSI